MDNERSAFEKWYTENGYYHDTISERKDLMLQAWQAASGSRQGEEVEENGLKCCPFCGGASKMYGNPLDGYHVDCHSCSANHTVHMCMEAAEKAWNTRASSPANQGKE